MNITVILRAVSTLVQEVEALPIADQLPQRTFNKFALTIFQVHTNARVCTS